MKVDGKTPIPPAQRTAFHRQGILETITLEFDPTLFQTM